MQGNEQSQPHDFKESILYLKQGEICRSNCKSKVTHNLIMPKIDGQSQGLEKIDSALVSSCYEGRAGRVPFSLAK